MQILKDGVSYDSLVKWPHVLVSPSGDAQGVVDEYLSRENKSQAYRTYGCDLLGATARP